MRFRQLQDGRQSVLLDYGESSGRRYEFLKLYLLPGDTAKVKRANAKTMREANAIMRQRTEGLLASKAEAQNRQLDGNISLVDWLRQCMEDGKRRGLRDSVKTSNTIKTLEQFAPDTRLASVDKEFCLSYITYLRNTYTKKDGKMLATKTAATYSETLRTALNEAVRVGRIAENPWNKLEAIEKIAVPESMCEYLTIDEVKRLAATPCRREDIKQAFLFACFCGLRISDVEKLRWADIEVKGKRHYMNIVMQKTTTPIHLPLSEQALKWMPERELDRELVFDGLHNKGNLGINIAKWVESAGITKHVTFHTSRHTFATMLLTLGVDLYVVSKLLGHSSVKHTQIYAKIIDKRKDEAVNLADKIEW